MHHWQQIEHAGNCVGGGNQIGRRIGGESLPVGCREAGRKMSAGRMAVDKNALAALAPQHQAGRAHLLNNVGDRAVGAEIVAGDRDRDAARIRTRCHLRKHRRLERSPPAAMNEHRERRLVIVLSRKKIDDPARRRAVSNPGLRVVRGCAVGGRFALPARKYFRMLGHPGAIVVFNLVIHGHVSSLGGFLGSSFGSSLGRARKGPSFAPGQNNVIS